MTPQQFKKARQTLNLSQSEMAEALKLSDSRSVRRLELGEREISGPIQVAIAYMLRFGLLPAEQRLR